MATEQDEKRAWDVIDKVGVCMMATQFDGGVRARPMEAHADRAEGLIWFLTDIRAAKDEEVEAWPDICLVFIDPEEKVYVSVSGRAEVTEDRERIRQMWSDRQQAWWPEGPADPNVRVICFVPELIEYWDGPANPAVARREFLKARATGEKPNLGERRKKTIELG